MRYEVVVTRKAYYIVDDRIARVDFDFLVEDEETAMDFILSCDVMPDDEETVDVTADVIDTRPDNRECGCGCGRVWGREDGEVRHARLHEGSALEEVL